MSLRCEINNQLGLQLESVILKDDSCVDSDFIESLEFYNHDSLIEYDERVMGFGHVYDISVDPNPTFMYSFAS